MEHELDAPPRHTFVIRVGGREGERLSGVIHHVATGEKRRFDGLADLVAAIRRIVRGEAPRWEAP